MSDDGEPRNNEEKTKRKMPAGKRFEPGNPGRPKGSRNKLGEAFISAMHDDFNKHGAAVIARVRDEKPDAYLKVVASILPKELNVNTNALGDLTDDDIATLIAELRDQGGTARAPRSGSRTAH